MSLGLLEFGAAGEVAQHREAGGGFDLGLAELQVGGAGDAVEDYAGEVQGGVEALVAQHFGGDAAGYFGGVGHQQHRGAQQFGELGGGAFLI